MKKIILFIVFAVVANASYDKAKLFYDAKEYQKAVEEAKSSTSEYSNPKLHLIWGESEEALGHEKLAMSAYERVVMLDADDVATRMKLVKIYNKTHRGDLATEMQKELQNYQLTPEQRSSLELLGKKDINSIKAKATLSVGHDSNINVSAKADDLNSYYSTTTNEGEKATLFSRVNGSVSYINQLGEKGGWYARADLKLYYQANFDASYYNMFKGGIAGGIGYAGSNYTLYLPLSYDRVHYLETDLFGQMQLAPKFNLRLSKDFILNLNAKYASRTYEKDSYKGMGDSSYGAGAGLYYLFNQNFVYLNFKYEDFKSTETLHNSYIDRTMVEIDSGVNYHFGDIMNTRVDYKYRNGNYDDVSNLLNPSVTSKRADTYNQVAVKLSHYFNKSYELFISDTYMTNSSNYVPANYTKNIAMFGISANY